MFISIFFAQCLYLFIHCLFIIIYLAGKANRLWFIRWQIGTTMSSMLGTVTLISLLLKQPSDEEVMDTSASLRQWNAVGGIWTSACLFLYLFIYFCRLFSFPTSYLYFTLLVLLYLYLLLLFVHYYLIVYLHIRSLSSHHLTIWLFF